MGAAQLWQTLGDFAIPRISRCSTRADDKARQQQHKTGSTPYTNTKQNGTTRISLLEALSLPAHQHNSVGCSKSQLKDDGEPPLVGATT